MSIPFTWVYLIHDPFTGLIKIGRSGDPFRRLKQLRKQDTHLPLKSDFHLIDAWRCDAVVETQIHSVYQSRRVRGEWFRLGFIELNILSVLLLPLKRFRSGTTVIETPKYDYLGEHTFDLWVG